MLIWFLEMINALISFLGGIILLVAASHKLIKAAEKISRAFKLSPLIIGVTLVAISTSLPEMSVSVIALLKGDIGLSVGNIIGSNVLNVLMIFSTAILIKDTRIGTTKTQKNAFILLMATAVFLLAQIPAGKAPILTGGILLIISVLLLAEEYFWAVYGRKHEDKILFDKETKSRFSPVDLILTAVSVGGIIGGGYLMVNGIQVISYLTGLSTTFLGLTVSAAATSFPEFLTTIYSQEDHQEKISIGSIIGSNIYNLILIGGILILISGNRLTMPLTETVWLIITTVGFFGLLRFYRGRVIPRITGGFLLIILIIYLFTLNPLSR